MGFPSDVTDNDWEIINKYFDRTNKGESTSPSFGRPSL